MLIHLGHSPDPDDAFMFWGLASGEVDPRRFEFEHVLKDIQTLNTWALDGKLEVSAISLARLPARAGAATCCCRTAPRWARATGRSSSPATRCRSPTRATSRSRCPGELTTAFLVLRMCMGKFRYRAVPFDQILDEVKSGSADAGLLIHEGQLTYEAEGLKKVVDLGEWWLLETGLPLPLGANVARRDIGTENLFELSDVLRDSIQAGLDNREEAMEYAMQFGRGLDTELADRFVGMYVNELTCDYGDEGRQAVRELMKRAEGLGTYDHPVKVEFVG